MSAPLAPPPPPSGTYKQKEYLFMHKNKIFLNKKFFKMLSNFSLPTKTYIFLADKSV